jgi:LacI family transcriptional regulator
MGSRPFLTEEFGHLRLVEIVDVHEDRDEARDRMSDLLKIHPDLKGIYNAGGATAGISEAIAECPQLIFVAHDVTRGNEALLPEGRLDAVIDQNARLQIREALDTLKHAVRNEPYRMVPPRGQTIFRENLPSEGPCVNA